MKEADHRFVRDIAEHAVAEAVVVVDTVVVE